MNKDNDKVIGIEYKIDLTAESKEVTLKIYGKEYKEIWKYDNGQYCESSISSQLDADGYSDRFIEIFEELENDPDMHYDLIEEMENDLYDGCES